MGDIQASRGEERHTVQRLARGQKDTPYDEDKDWGSHAAANRRGRVGSVEVFGHVIADPMTPCSLCEPGYVCAFHRDET